MLCSQCHVNIPPEWKNVIASNECPNCKGPILNEEISTLLNELKEAIQEMPADPEGLATWLLSNYELKKIGSAKPVLKFYHPPTKPGQSFHPKSQIDEDVESANVKFKTKNDWFERAGAPQPAQMAKMKQAKTQNLSQIAKMLDNQYGDNDYEEVADEIEEEEHYQPHPRLSARSGAAFTPQQVAEADESLVEAYAAIMPSVEPTEPAARLKYQQDRMKRLAAQQKLQSEKEI